jgi:hypothetical protein
MKYFIGPVSKNIVDAVIDYNNEYNSNIVFIPSRRQIENTGGYVNNWTTEEFCYYVRNKSLNSTLIERDHGGPGQGYLDDNGYESLKFDCHNMDIIHIDPWKKYPDYKDGLKWTIDMLEFCYKENPAIQFEIGTEEAIRYFSVKEMDIFLKDITRLINILILKQIKYVVVQCGTKLEETKNIGCFSSERLRDMLSIVEKYGFEAKEHNGDWVSIEIIQQKEMIGLKNINIAPEFGEIETSVILESMKSNNTDFQTFYSICYESKRWVKWVDPSFNPDQNKEKLIRICGHYVFSEDRFIKLKEKYSECDSKIQKAIKNKLHMLNTIYYERTKCIICKSSNFKTYFEENYEAPLSFALYDKKDISYFMPFNVVLCNECRTVQTKYLGNPNIIYASNHNDTFGELKKSMHSLFSKFIVNTNDITGIIEVGASTDILSRYIRSLNKIKYTIIDPDFKGDPTDLTIIPQLLENTNTSDISGNTVIMSNLFEHLYDPVGTIQKLYKENIKYIYLNNPDLEYGCKSNTYIILNTEHIYYIENDFLYKLFENNGYELIEKENFNTHTIFMKFQRKTRIDKQYTIINKTSYEDTCLYFSEMLRKIQKINKLLENKDRKYYMWPAATYNIVLFVNGLKYYMLAGLLDNSPNKIGKKLYGYNIECFDFKKILTSGDESITIILGGSSDYRNELMVEKKGVEVILLDSI